MRLIWHSRISEVCCHVPVHQLYVLACTADTTATAATAAAAATAATAAAAAAFDMIRFSHSYSRMSTGP